MLKRSSLKLGMPAVDGVPQHDSIGRVHLRIALTGAQGTGKSTLARELGQALRDAVAGPVTMMSGLGEYAAAAGIATGQQADAASVMALARWHLRREAQVDAAVAAADQGAAPALTIFDRCLLDTLAYAEVLGCLAAAELADLRAATLNSSRRYRQLLFLRITGDYAVTGPHDETPAFRRAIETAIAAQAAALGLALHEVRMPPQAAADVAEAVRRQLRGR